MPTEEGDPHDVDTTCKEMERYAELSIVSFPHRLWAIVSKYKDGLIRWSIDGTKIIIDEKSFEEEILDKYTGLLRSNKLRSFKRRLNAYGFRTVVSRISVAGSGDKSPKSKLKVQCEFSHPNFQRGKPHLLKHVICQDPSYKRKLALLRLKRKNRDDDLRCAKCARRLSSDSFNDAATDSEPLAAGALEDQMPAQSTSSKSDTALVSPTSTAEVHSDKSGALKRDRERDDRMVMLPYVLSGRGYVPLVPSRGRPEARVSPPTRHRQRPITAFRRTKRSPSIFGRVSASGLRQKLQDFGDSRRPGHTSGGHSCHSSDSPPRSVRHVQDSPSRSIRHDQDGPSRSIRHDQDSPSRSIRHDQDSPSRSIRHDQDSPSRSIRNDQDDPSRSIRNDQDSPSRSIRHDQDSPSRSIRHDQDGPSRSIRHGQDGPSRSIRNDQDVPSRSIRHGEDGPSRSIRHSQDGSSWFIRHSQSLADQRAMLAIASSVTRRPTAQPRDSNLTA